MDPYNISSITNAKGTVKLLFGTFNLQVQRFYLYRMMHLLVEPKCALEPLGRPRTGW